METTFIKQQLRRYRKLRRRDEFLARFKGYFTGFREEGVAVRLVKGGAIVAGVIVAVSYLFTLLRK
ncbi:MAG TPA: hypothetical protein VN446_08295 [Candidatus Acidoferrum sp.]|nr:hypothetical protein [Candidatus Acidoferrum sp.]